MDSIELYHLAGSHERVIDAVTRALAHSLSLHGSARSIQLGERLGLKGAFGGSQDILQLVDNVLGVYQKDLAARQTIEQSKWDALGVLMTLKRAMSDYAADRLESALDVSHASQLCMQVKSDS